MIPTKLGKQAANEWSNEEEAKMKICSFLVDRRGSFCDFCDHHVWFPLLSLKKVNIKWGSLAY